MEPPPKRLRLSPPVEHQRFQESSSDDDEFYAPPGPKEQPKVQPQVPEETDVDDEVDILDEGEEVEDIDEAEVNIRRAQSLNKVRSKWDEICEKYGREFENADEIDLNTLEVVVDKGHISQMRDENDVGNRQSTQRREKLKGQNAAGHLLSRAQDSDAQEHKDRDVSPSKIRTSSKAQQTIYEDESSDDDFLYEKPAPSVVLAPRQPQGINQIKPRSGSRTVVEKRTVITTRRITTSTIRGDRSDSRDDIGRQRSHERTREVHRYKSSQEKIVETSSDDELVQRSPPQQPAQIQDGAERPPSPKGKVSLWAPRMKAGRPKLAYDERGTPQRHVSRRDRTARYDEHGRKIRKQRNDRGKMRKPEHLRKTKFVQRYPHLHQGPESNMPTDPSSPLPLERPHAPLNRTESMPMPTIMSEEEPKPKLLPKPVVFERNKVDKAYDFSDEEDDALPQRLLPSLLIAQPADVFLGQGSAQQAEEILQPKYDVGYEIQHDHKGDAALFELPHSPPPPYTEYNYQPRPMSACNPTLDHAVFVAPMAPMNNMETMHQLLPLEDDSQDTSGFMDTYLDFPDTTQHTELPEHKHDVKSLENAPAEETVKLEESENELSIPIDPALLALDAENRAASLERATEFAAASDPTEEAGMAGESAPTLPFVELVGCRRSLEEGIALNDEDDSDEDLFAPQAPVLRALTEEKTAIVLPTKVDEILTDSAPAKVPDEEPTAALEGMPTNAVSVTEFRDEEDNAKNFALSTLREEQPAVTSEKIYLVSDATETDILEEANDLVHLSPSEDAKMVSVLASAGKTHMRNITRTEVPDSDADSEDELLTLPYSQPPPHAMVVSSGPSSAHVSPRSKEAMKRVRFSANLILDETSKPKLSPTQTSILRGTSANQISRPPSPPAFESQPLSAPAEFMDEDEDEDDLALVPSTPAARSKSRTKAALNAADMPRPAAPDPLKPVPEPTPPLSQTPCAEASELSTGRPRTNEHSCAKTAVNTTSSSRSRSSTPQFSSKQGSNSKSTPLSKATPPRLFSLSVSPQPVEKRKLRASLLSESASTTPRRAATSTPPPQPQQIGGVRRRGAAGRLMSASPSLGGPPSGVKRQGEDWSR